MPRSARQRPKASNADSSIVFPARGTMCTYGVDGVCHQVANQVLYSTGSAGVGPSTVSQANGYWAGLTVYGTYGLQHAAWRNKIAACMAASRPPSASKPSKSRRPSGPGPSMNANLPVNMSDEFGEQVGKVLGAGKAAQIAQLLNLRAQFQTTAAMLANAMFTPTADEINARHQQFFDGVSKLLDPSDFKAIFGVAPGVKIDLVLADPTK